MRVLVTGATGFIGSAVVARLASTDRHRVRTVSRAHMPASDDRESVIVGNIDDSTSWEAALRGVDVVIHTAARVHVMRESAIDPLAEFRRVNVAGTLRLAREAARRGVRRFVFLSSIKVNGERTEAGRPYLPDDPPAPADPYGVSKQEAEQGLWQVVAGTGMELVIIRPVLVYGPGVRGNFHSLLRLMHKGVPLPLGAIGNLRSLVGLGNLVDLIFRCIDHPAAANKVFLVSDGEDLSTPQLLCRLAEALGMHARLFSVPPGALQIAGKLMGASHVVQRLCESLQVDISATRRILDWCPPESVDEALRKAAAAFLGQHNK